jgi:hypothetical protein
MASTAADVLPLIETESILEVEKADEPAEKLEKNDNPLNEGFAKYVEETLQKWHLPGVAIAVVDGDKVYTEV